MSHDLRNPLNNISLAAQNLLEEPTDIKDLAASINRSAGEMLGLIQDFDDARNSITFEHRGAAQSYSFVLEWAGKQAVPMSFISPALQIASGDIVRITPTQWQNLRGATVSLSITHSNGTEARQLLSSTPPADSVKIARVEVNPHGTRSIALGSVIAGTTPSGTEFVGSFALMQNGRSIAHYEVAAPISSAATGSRTDIWKLSPTLRGTFQLVTSSNLITEGQTLNSVSDTRMQTIALK